jgi:hypothetical protein
VVSGQILGALYYESNGSVFGEAGFVWLRGSDSIIKLGFFHLFFWGALVVILSALS